MNTFGIRFVIVTLFSCVSSVSAFGYGEYDRDRNRDGYYYGGGDFEAEHRLSVAAGISSPSQTTSLFENPAGLIYNDDLKIQVAGAASNNQFNPLGASGNLFLGNGIVGGGLGLSTFSAFANNSGYATFLNYGLAAEIPSWYLAFGVSGSYLIGETGTPAVYDGQSLTQPWGLNVGAIINPGGDVRGGLTVYGLLAGVQALGAGISADPTSFATFALDAATSPGFQGTTLTPGMMIHIREVQLSVGYGIPLDTYPSYLRRGASLGVGVRIGYYFHIQAYYNEMALYYVGLVFQI